MSLSIATPGPKPILVVEDDPNDLEFILLALDHAEFLGEVVVARDGVAALDYLCRKGLHERRDEGNPSVVLLDVRLPKVDGYEVLRVMRSEATLKAVPVVMMTSLAEPQDMDRGYESGANAYVVKPIGLQQFHATVQKLTKFWAQLNISPSVKPTRL
ncbi:response regulator [Pseudorhodoferax sp. Leaf265]|uniref:response regulator n=1 Tax=Pseudorhodoferax sp. Leaf265 TaxID=1736315 RepID=UPI0006F910AA|nr:response regulator [Pseudorhodoferax sp. Leaf265]KQP12061.1 two-component system response regulator [Pseudorhodoferax sp. Leaf265]